jgi:CheY-like chemotaxis protein
MASQKLILVADDSSDDFLLIQAAFRKAGLPHELYHVIDGDQALAYLRREAPFEDAERFPFPDLMLLDLMMPRMSGFDVLALLRERPDLRIPVIVMLSGSILPEDAQKALKLGAVDYFSKPTTLAALVELASTFHRRWLHDASARTEGPPS